MMKRQIQALLGVDHPWSGLLQWHDSTDSTNTRAKELAAAGAPHGTLVLAGHQTGGRGRMGRSFHSPAGQGIYLSLILRPDCPPTRLMHLTCAVGAAMCDAVEEAAGIRPGIKWINDLVLGQRKLGGILAELSLCPQSGNIRYAVVGIGINCCQAQEDFPEEIREIATSLFAATGRKPDRAALAAAMIRHLQKMDTRLLTDRDAILESYRRDCITLGKQVRVHGSDIRRGTALDITEDGALLVRFSDGSVEAVQSGEASVRGLWGYV